MSLVSVHSPVQPSAFCESHSMTSSRSALAALLLCASSAAFAQPNPPSLRVIDIKHPEEVALAAWHRAILRGDFAAYDALTEPLLGLSADQQRGVYEHHRSSMPPTFKITEPKIYPTGAKSLTAVGCRDGFRTVGSVSLAPHGSTWKVLSTAWSRSWSAAKCVD